MPAIEVSCPSCGRAALVEMELYKPPKGGLRAMMEELFPESFKHYTFHGEKPCECGQIIDVAMNVGNCLTEGNP
jgi:hypothetical protein